MTREELDYKTAFKIACALLNGDILYGTDAESIFSEIMKKDGCICSFDYENYILTHLNELRDDKAESEAINWKFVSKNGWYECSKCGNQPLKNKWGFDELSSFCPYCGAHMGGKIVNE